MTKKNFPRLILGSSSARRLELLQSVDLIPDEIAAADIDETPHKKETPVAYVRRMAKEKNAALSDKYTNDFLITADTTGVVGRRILGKPADEKEEEAFLRLLSGRSHQILTAVTIRAPNGKVSHRLSKSRVTFKKMSDAEIKAYVRHGEWKGMACGYRFQLYAGRFVASINGSASGIIGLPLYETVQMLQGLGYKGLGYEDRD